MMVVQDGSKQAVSNFFCCSQSLSWRETDKETEADAATKAESRERREMEIQKKTEIVRNVERQRDTETKIEIEKIERGGDRENRQTEEWERSYRE